MLRENALRFIPSMRHLDMRYRLMNLKSLGVDFRSIVDVGAGQGDWTRLAAAIWPAANIVGFEPNKHERDALDRLTKELPRFRYHMCFLGRGRQDSVAYLDRGRITSLLAPQDVQGAKAAEAPMESLDELIGSGSVAPPDFVKVDVQGYELEVLRGASHALAGCTAVLLECSLLRLFDGAPRIDEVIEFMRERQLIWYDIAGIVRRPSDDALWQLDLIFLREGNALLTPQPH